MIFRYLSPKAYMSCVDVKAQVWGYPTPNPDDGIEAYRNSLIYEGKVCSAKRHGRSQYSQRNVQLLEAYQFIQILTLGSIKLGALFFYRRIFVNRSKLGAFRTLLTIFMIITIFWTIAMTIMNGLQCGSHIFWLWDASVDNKIKCCI